MHRLLSLCLAGFVLILPHAVLAESAPAPLPAPYQKSETRYLKTYPELRPLMERMVAISATQMADPSQDILHNRVCAALAYSMSRKAKSGKRVDKMAPATDLLHNISKEDKAAVLTDPAVRARVVELANTLKSQGFFKGSPQFLSDLSVIENPKVGANLALIHHLTGAVATGEILRGLGGFSESEIQAAQAAVMEHSTGYWYFRDSVDQAVGRKDAWKNVYPEPEGALSQFVHDADLVSQFVPESVLPEGAKWRQLAAKRWGAKGPKEEAQVIYYVFDRLFNEAKTPQGRAEALAKWRGIRDALVVEMGLKPGQDPLKVLGVPAAFAPRN